MKCVPFNLIATVTSFSTFEQFMKRFSTSLTFTFSSECITPSKSLNEHGCLYWLTEWQLYLSHVHTSSDPYGDQICTQLVGTQVTLTTIPPPRHWDNIWQHFFTWCSFPLCPSWCQPAVVECCLHVSIHLPVPASQHWDCQCHCVMPCVHTLSMMCPSGE